MIQIQRPEQFARAADRLRKEPQSIRRHERGLYAVTNIRNGHTYHVRITRRHGFTFGTCTCEAGMPTNHKHVPMVCKHFAAVVIFLRAVRDMRRHAASH